MAEESCEMYGYTPSPELDKVFNVYHKLIIRQYSMHILLRCVKHVRTRL